MTIARENTLGRLDEDGLTVVWRDGFWRYAVPLRDMAKAVDIICGAHCHPIGLAEVAKALNVDPNVIRHLNGTAGQFEIQEDPRGAWLYLDFDS